ncbi:copper chaperone Copz family protein [Paenibacillus ferrarius]|uniref:copper chaperone Copz family protein n=1 Tax=Paenibacillus ferrarius TaxID=1469647 RepID=UPI0009A515EC|nr:copper chaperone Copz family protein [Paenibacillus ferrarius]
MEGRFRRSEGACRGVALECPSCGKKGKNVQLITLKSLLKASALETIAPENSYLFCSNSACSIVYFSMDVPVCYCFDWTRERLLQTSGTDQQPANQIKAHVQAGRCGCEVNNPQGACCLRNVNSFVRGLKEV